MPDVLDLSFLRAPSSSVSSSGGLLPGEEPLPEEGAEESGSTTAHPAAGDEGTMTKPAVATAGK